MMINDWKPETRSLIRALKAAGVEIVGGDNGEEQSRDAKGIVELLTACDEARLYVRINGVRKWLYLVYGNAPGELVCDYVFDETLDKVVDAHYEKWSGRKQPVKNILAP